MLNDFFMRRYYGTGMTEFEGKNQKGRGERAGTGRLRHNSQLRDFVLPLMSNIEHRIMNNEGLNASIAFFFFYFDIQSCPPPGCVRTGATSLWKTKIIYSCSHSTCHGTLALVYKSSSVNLNLPFAPMT